MKFITNLTLIGFLLCFSFIGANAQTPTNANPPTIIEHSVTHLKAAENFLIATGINTQFGTIVDNIITQYSGNVPADKKDLFVSVMKKFMGKYYSWEALKGTLSSIYADEFSEPELKQLADFYNTPAGKKFGSKQAVLTQKGMQAGQQVVEQHQAELQQMIQDAIK
jgi:hypothetical protein